MLLCQSLNDLHYFMINNQPLYDFIIVAQIYQNFQAFSVKCHSCGLFCLHVNFTRYYTSEVAQELLVAHHDSEWFFAQINRQFCQVLEQVSQ